MQRFFEAVGEEPSKDVRDFVLLSLLTGARKADVISMRWESLGLERGEWHIAVDANNLIACFNH